MKLCENKKIRPADREEEVKSNRSEGRRALLPSVRSPLHNINNIYNQHKIVVRRSTIGLRSEVVTVSSLACQSATIS